MVQSNHRQHFFDSATLRLQPRRQLQSFTQSFECLVDVEAGRIGRDLEKNSAWFAEVNGVEVLPVKYRCHIQRHRLQFFPPTLLRRVIGGAKGYVMYAAGSHAPVHELRLDKNVNVITYAMRRRREAKPVTLFSVFTKAHFLEDGGSHLKARFAQSHAEKAMDCVFGGDITCASGFRCRFNVASDEFDA